jgi:MATE family multidrug resistance protein
MLAGYSIDSMNAAVISGSLTAIFTLVPMSIAGAAEIYVGQYNGSKRYDKLASPVWQMIYLSFFSSIFFIPIAYFSDYINMLPSYYLQEGVAYQRIILYYGFTPGIISALSAFFIGRGEAKIVTCVVLFGMLINTILDYFLIYGYENIIPKMGCKGAAIATVIAEILQAIILATVFFNSRNRAVYKTFENRQYNKKLFLGCVKIGAPLSLGNIASMLAWYLVQSAVSHVSKDIATVYGIGLTVYILFMFIGEGLNKAIATLAANMIGRKDLPSIKKTYKVFIVISAALGLITALPLIIAPRWLLTMLDLLQGDISVLYEEIRIAFCIITLNVILESFLCSTWGILVAGGDAKYPNIAYQACLWGSVVLPVALLYSLDRLNSAVMIYMLTTLCTALSLFLVYKRYKSMKWCNQII